MNGTHIRLAGSILAARSRYGMPFWRVMRPTKVTDGRSGSRPSERARSGSRFGFQSVRSMPL